MGNASLASSCKHTHVSIVGIHNEEPKGFQFVHTQFGTSICYDCAQEWKVKRKVGSLFGHAYGKWIKV